MERTRLVAAVVAVATAFGSVMAGVLPAPAPVHAVAAPAPRPEPGAASPAVSLWASGLEGAVTAANRAW